MATKKMTFTLPENVASLLLRQVAARDRSRYVTEAIIARLQQREKRLVQACEAANADQDVQTIQSEWATLSDEVAEPWSDASPR